MNVAPADYVTFAPYHLGGAAAAWWENFVAMQPAGQETTWQVFWEAFREHHIPEGLMDIKKQEFYHLTQGRRSVEE